MIIKYILITISIIFIFSNYSVSQDTDELNKNLFNEAMKLIDIDNFKEALLKLKVLDSIEKGTNSATKYNIGLCYLKSKYEKIKAIPYLEFTANNENFKGENIVYLYLGDLYHLDYKFDKAISCYELFKKKEGSFSVNYKHAERMIEICNNAKEVYADSVKFKLLNFGMPINTPYSEYTALVSTDNSIIYFTRKLNYDIPDSTNKLDTLDHIYVSYFESEKWSAPKEILSDISLNKNISLAGLSPDGGLLFVNINGNIFSCRVTEGKYSELTRLNFPLNTEYWEGRVSITADGTEFYFSSNRPGGFGGMDIYKSEINDNGKWSIPINLGPLINTEFNEGAPFIHPDKKKLFFSSAGHTTMGGYDIFQTFLVDSIWSKPTNMGYPINTVNDDLHFILSANGKKGYFSSNKNSSFNCHDIYEVDLRKTINLTMVKGRITAGNPATPVKATIKLIDKETGEKVKYVYDPNPITGKYLMVFPPGKNYDIIFEAEGFLPHLVNFYFPEQEYFYESYQEIHLDSVSALGEKIGEKITISSSFKNLNNSSTESMQEEAPNEYYNNLLNLIDNIVSATDSILENRTKDTNSVYISDSENANLSEVSSKDFSDLFKMVDALVEATDITGFSKFLVDSVNFETVSDIFYFSKNNEHNNLQEIVIGNDTIYTTPSLTISKQNPKDSFLFVEKSKRDSLKIDYEKIKENYKKVILTYVIKFSSGKDIVKDEYKNELLKLANLAKDNPILAFDVIGFCDKNSESNGNEINCITLGNNRAESLKKVIEETGVEDERIVSNHWNGTPNMKKEDNFCAKIRLYEIVDKPLYEIEKIDIINFDEKELKVENIKHGQEIRLNNIFFDYASTKLTSKSTTELLNVVKFLNNNSEIRIEIAGHTDNTGTSDGNLKLSKGRAQTVADFLKKEGINEKRLVVNGYGDTKPIAENYSEEGKEQNRRVVFLILEK